MCIIGAEGGNNFNPFRSNCAINKMKKIMSVKKQLILFLSLFTIYLVAVDGGAGFLLAVFIAVASSIAGDAILQYIKTKRLTLTSSSIITGLIIGFVISSDQPWWILTIASLLAICSKHLIRVKQGPLFNPAAFGIFLVMIFLSAKTQWRGTYLWYILLPAGIYFVYKIRKLELLFSYGIVALFLFGFQAILQKSSLGNIFWYLSYFFIFIMLIEPKTTPIKSRGKKLFGACVAVLIFSLTNLGVKFDVELLSLLACNFASPLFNILSNRKGGR